MFFTFYHHVGPRSFRDDWRDGIDQPLSRVTALMSTLLIFNWTDEFFCYGLYECIVCVKNNPLCALESFP